MSSKAVPGGRKRKKGVPRFRTFYSMSMLFILQALPVIVILNIESRKIDTCLLFDTNHTMSVSVSVDNKVTTPGFR